MIQRIVVPLDGSSTSEAILPQLRRILGKRDFEVILVRAVGAPPTDAGPQAGERLFEAAESQAHALLLRLNREGIAVRSVTRVGPAAGVILDVASEAEASLIAMATHGSTGLRRLLLGSITEEVLHRARLPVLVVRPFESYTLLPPGEPGKQPIRNILFPVGEEDLGLTALDSVSEVAHLFESRVVILRVLDTGRKESASLEARAHAEVHLKEATRPLAERGIDTVVLVESGEPAEVILNACRTVPIDLVAMATRGRTGLSRVLEGSVTERVLREAICPVLVVPAKKEADRPPAPLKA